MYASIAKCEPNDAHTQKKTQRNAVNGEQQQQQGKKS